MQLLGPQSVFAVVQREGSKRCIKALKSLSGNDQDRARWKKAQILQNKYDKLCCAEGRETVMRQKVPKHAEGRV